jgi:ABC-type multidrug transport system fused ATPase/permease subunit
VAHRLTTVKECDQIYLISKGIFVAQGTFKELSENDPYFKKLSNQEIQ